jgi:histidinol-phosphate aminotransferase
MGLSIKEKSRGVDTYANPLTGEWMGDTPFDFPIKAKLNANENPYGQSKNALKAFLEEMKDANRYGSPVTAEFTNFLANQYQVKNSQVILSAGSLELLQLAALTFGARQGNIISAFPTFEPLLRNAQAIGCNWRQVQVDLELRHDLKLMEESITDDTSLMYICNPNNPTGTIVDPEELKSFCQRVSQRVPVFVDEAYNEFLDNPEEHTMLPLIQAGYPIIICKTFSKLHGFAGLRAGYAIGHDQLINQMTRYRNFQTTMTRPTMKAAMVSYLDEEFKSYCLAKNNEARAFVWKELRKRGFEPIESHTSFMVFPINMPGGDFKMQMAEHGVAIRSWEFHDKQWCRVSVGTMDNMKDFLKALDKVTT